VVEGAIKLSLFFVAIDSRIIFLAEAAFIMTRLTEVDKIYAGTESYIINGRYERTQQ
jgi:hypothetical protein